MRKIKYKKGRKVHPALLEYTGRHRDVTTQMQLFVYDANDLTEYNDFQVTQCEKCFNSSKINWLNVHGLNDIEVVKTIGDYLKVDSFMLGDILNTTKR